MVPMRIRVHVIPWSKKESVEQTAVDIDGVVHYKVKIREKPIDGEANEALMDCMAHFLHVRPRAIQIISGKTSREKLLEITP